MASVKRTILAAGMGTSPAVLTETVRDNMANRKRHANGFSRVRKSGIESVRFVQELTA